MQRGLTRGVGRICFLGVVACGRVPNFASAVRFAQLSFVFGKVVSTELEAILGATPATVNAFFDASGAEAASGVGKTRVKRTGSG